MSLADPAQRHVSAEELRDALGDERVRVFDADVREVTGSGSACLVNALSPEAFRGEGPGAYSRPPGPAPHHRLTREITAPATGSP